MALGLIPLKGKDKGLPPEAPKTIPPKAYMLL